MINKETVSNLIIDKKILGKNHIENYDEYLNVCYVFDHGAVRGAGVSICSVCENNKNDKFIFHALCTDLTDDDIKKLELITDKYDTTIILYFIDKSAEIIKQLDLGNFHVATWYRIFIPYILECKKVLYIDADILNLSSLTELFRIDMENHFIAAAPDTEKTNRNRNNMLNLKSHIYFNAGVLLINVNRWIDNDCSDKILDIVKKYGQKLVLPDQDALNILFSLSGDTYYLDKKYNRVELWKEQNIKEKLRETVLLHFVQTKPWQEAWLYEKRPYIENLYAQYEKISPWKDMPLERKKQLSYHDKRKRAVFLLRKGKILDSLYWYKKYLKAKIMKED
jgi:UDP-glucose:(glucosyl)LPS alpha-1,3-glucosyltransferase